MYYPAISLYKECEVGYVFTGRRVQLFDWFHSFVQFIFDTKHVFHIASRKGLVPIRTLFVQLHICIYIFHMLLNYYASYM